MELFLLLDGSLRRKRARFHANGVWGSSGGPRGGGDCGATTVGSQTAGPAPPVTAHASRQKAVRADPTGGFEHSQGAVEEIGSGRRLGQRCQRAAQRLGLRAK